jgi:hypothetical protein
MSAKQRLSDEELYPICHEVIRRMFEEEKGDSAFTKLAERQSIPVLIHFSDKSLKFDFEARRVYAFSTRELSELAELKKDLLFLELSDMFIHGDAAEMMASISVMPSPNMKDSTRLRCYKIKLARNDASWRVV